jgi:hypothetical protein
MYFQLYPSMRHTEETEFGLLLKTPTKMDGEVTSGKKNPKSGNSGTLAQEIMSAYPPTMAKLGLLPTPTTQEPTTKCKLTENGRRVTKDGNNSHSLNIGRMASMGMLPTPTAMDSSNATANMKSTQVKEGSMHSVTLARAMAMGMLPTPAMSNYKEASSTEALEARGRLKPMADNLADQFAVSGRSSQLNPQFVMEMMGFPKDWTLLPFLNGEQSQSKPEVMP